MTEFSRIDINFEKRRPRYPHVHVCHIDQSIVYKNPELAIHVKEVVDQKQLPFSTRRLEQIFEREAGMLVKVQEQHDLSIPDKDYSITEMLLHSLEAATSYSSKEDLIQSYTSMALEQEAKRLGCNMIMYGDNSTLLAIKTISNTSKGRGIALHLELAVEYLDPLEEILHVKPLRDILGKEIGIFNHYRNLNTFVHPNITTGMPKKTSIERMTAEFILELENEFPSTVSTITRTAFKISPYVTGKQISCILCHR
jgi:cytoplasmic tRNA 2-thiolation protein 2